MSSQTLLCHPATPCLAVRDITTDVVQTASGDLRLTYRILARPEALRLPSAQPTAATDHLWQHTCCEAFIGIAGEPAYREFNFSPSSQWAAYQFSDCRQRDTAFQPPATPRIVLQCLAEQIVLEASLPSPLLPQAAEWQIGLSVVIEAADGSKSYWALAHYAAQPDFHIRQSFALTLHRNTP